MRSRYLPLACLFVLPACAPGGKGGIGKGTPPPPPTTTVSASVATSASVTPVDPESTASIATVTPGEGIGIAPGPSGHLGAWLALGPFRLDEKSPPATTTTFKPPGVTDDHALDPRHGVTLPARIDIPTREVGKDGKPTTKVKGFTSAPATWGIASSGEGAIDLEKTFGWLNKPAVGYLGGVLRLPVAMNLVMLVGSDDGCELIVDGKTVFVRDASRPQRDDDDLVPLALAKGDHKVIFKLHQHDGGWAMRVRLVDTSLRPALGVRLILPGATDTVASDLAKAMSWVRLIREPIATGYSIRTLVKYPEGAPLGVALSPIGSVINADSIARIEPHALGTVPIGPRSVGQLEATIGELSEKQIAEDEAGEKDLTVRVEIAGRRVEGAFHPRSPVRASIAKARATLERWKKDGRPAALPDDVAATLEHLSERLASYVSRGDGDVVSQLADAKELAALVDDADQGRDPIASRTGPMRVAHYARADGHAQAMGLYVPPSLATLPAGKKLPLYVGLHGMNGGPMSMVRVFFGGDDDKKSMFEMERTMGFAGPMPKLDGFVLAPHAHGNAMYRQLGEEEVMDAIAWAKARFPQIDADRVYLTGFSMGGIGAASIPFHHPDVFAASQPLCGYHSYAIRRDVAGRPRRPWETFLVDDRSNVTWADNGVRLPLYIVHGVHDLPEENSGVLIDAYEKLGFPVKHEHPDLGHDVWGWAYTHFDQVKWFGARKRSAHPKYIRFKTTRPRYGHDAWVHVDRLASPTEWGTIDASAIDKANVRITTRGIEALHLDRDPELMGAALTVTVDSKKLAFAEGAALQMYKDTMGWNAGTPAVDGLHKEGNVAGPIRDVWNEPLMVVYGTEDPTQTTANLEVAQYLSTIRYGVDVKYAVLKDSEVDPAAVPTKSVILVGNAKSNRITRALESELPMKVEEGSIVFAGKTYKGAQLGAAFVVPHPKAKQHYLLVVEGVDALGTFRALSLPELLPDFVIWDERLAPARGQTLLSFGAVLAGGFFDTKWKPPASFDDPMLAKTLPTAKNEKDATAYLP